MNEQGINLLKKDDVDELTKHQPSVEFRWYIFPLVPISHLHLQLPLPPSRPISSFFAPLRAVNVQPPPASQESNNPSLLALASKSPCEAPIVAPSPEREVEQEEDRADRGVVVEEGEYYDLSD